MNEFFYVKRLGDTRFEMRNGAMVLFEVPIAKAGWQTYRSFEAPEFEPGKDGNVELEQSADELLSDDTIASFNGVPVTIDHPPGGDWINPGNWKKYAVGHVTNARRGEGPLEGFVVGDFVVSADDAIKEIRAGLREVSPGMKFKPVRLSPGKGRKTNILADHVALVESGRCGEECAIGDSAMATKPIQTFRSILAANLKAVLAKAGTKDSDIDSMTGDVMNGIGIGDEAPADEGNQATLVIKVEGADVPSAAKTEDEAPPAGDDAAKGVESRIAALEDLVKQIMTLVQGLSKKEEPAPAAASADADTESYDPDAKKEEDAGSKDSRNLKDVFEKVVADAIALVPDFKEVGGSFDAAAAPKVTGNRICALKRRALVAASAAEATKSLIDDAAQHLTGASFDAAMPCPLVAPIFRLAVSERKAEVNASNMGPGFLPSVDQKAELSKAQTAAERMKAAHKKKFG